MKTGRSEEKDFLNDRAFDEEEGEEEIEEESELSEDEEEGEEEIEEEEDDSLIEGESFIDIKGLETKRVETLHSKPGLTLKDTKKGLINGNGFTNGRRGLINGNGLTNGLTNGQKGKSWDFGITNGLSHSNGISRIDGKRKRFARALAVLGISLLIFVAIIPPVINMIFPGKEGISIDGDFSDWAGKVKLTDSRTDSVRGGTNIVEYSSDLNDEMLCFYIKTEKFVFSDTAKDGVSAFFIFIDVDSNYETGYLINGLGADYKVELIGWDKSIRAVSLNVWNESRNGYDWNGFVTKGSVSYAAIDREIEVGIPKTLLGLDESKGENKKVVSVIVGYPDNISGGMIDISDVPVSCIGGSVKASVEYPVRGTIDALKENVVLIVRLNAYGSDVRINGFRLHRLGTASASDISQISIYTDNGNYMLDSADVQVGIANQINEIINFDLTTPLTLEKDKEKTLLIGVKARTEARAGVTFGLKFVGVSDIKTDYGVGIESQPNKLYYIGNTTGTIVIDGAFEDWANVEKRQDTKDGSANPNTDLKSYAASNDTSSISLYMKVGKVVLGGSEVPEVKLEKITNIGGVSGGVSGEPAEVDRDVALFYIDTDKNTSTGYCPYSFPIGADYLIKIEGSRGNIISSALYKHIDGREEYSWSRIMNVSSACAGSELEAQISFSLLGTNSTNGAAIYYQINGWKSEKLFYSNVPINLGISESTRTHTNGSRSAPVIDTGNPDYVEAAFGSVENSVKASNLAHTGCTISWITNVPASSVVRVYTDSAGTNEIAESPFTNNYFGSSSTKHYVTISAETIANAAEGTTFYFNVTSSNVDGSDTAPSSGLYSFCKAIGTPSPTGNNIVGIVYDSGYNPVNGIIVIVKDITHDSAYLSIISGDPSVGVDGGWMFYVSSFRSKTGALITVSAGTIIVAEAWGNGEGNDTTGDYTYQAIGGDEQLPDLVLADEPLGVPEFEEVIMPTIAVITVMFLYRTKKNRAKGKKEKRM